MGDPRHPHTGNNDPPKFTIDISEPPCRPNSPLLTQNQKDRQKLALTPYGNYHNYYFHRTASIPDSRLSILPKSIFSHRNILDLGCNAGKLTIEAITHLSASHALGIDLDPVLISRAREHLISAQEAHPNIASASCTFLCNDFMTPNFFSNFFSQHSHPDTILLLSITKWLHLHHGDAGLSGLFHDLFDLLPPGGYLVVEPQEWANYKRAVSRNTSLRPVFKGLKIRPNFEGELREVGFVLDRMIEREEGGFSRPLMLWLKPGVAPVAA